MVLLPITAKIMLLPITFTITPCLLQCAYLIQQMHQKWNWVKSEYSVLVWAVLKMTFFALREFNNIQWAYFTPKVCKSEIESNLNFDDIYCPYDTQRNIHAIYRKESKQFMEIAIWRMDDLWTDDCIR